MSKIQYKIESEKQGSEMLAWVRNNVKKGLQSGAVIVTLSRPNRTQEQNDLLWAVLTDFQSQCDFPRGSGIKRPKEHWKVIFMSAYRTDGTSFVFGINGEPVNLSTSTSALNKKEFSEVIEFLYATGSEWGVQWTDPAMNVFDQWRES